MKRKLEREETILFWCRSKETKHRNPPSKKRKYSFRQNRE
jgi:hypothetical protein